MAHNSSESPLTKALEYGALATLPIIDVAAAAHFLDEEGVIVAPWVQEFWGIHQSTSLAVCGTITTGIVATSELAATYFDNRGSEKAAQLIRRGGLVTAGAVALGVHVVIEFKASDISDVGDSVAAILGVGVGVLAGRGLARAFSRQ